MPRYSTLAHMTLASRPSARASRARVKAHSAAANVSKAKARPPGVARRRQPRPASPMPSRLVRMAAEATRVDCELIRFLLDRPALLPVLLYPLGGKSSV